MDALLLHLPSFALICSLPSAPAAALVVPSWLLKETRATPRAGSPSPLQDTRSRTRLLVQPHSYSNAPVVPLSCPVVLPGQSSLQVWLSLMSLLPWGRGTSLPAHPRLPRQSQLCTSASASSPPQPTAPSVVHRPPSPRSLPSCPLPGTSPFYQVPRAHLG